MCFAACVCCWRVLVACVCWWCVCVWRVLLWRVLACAAGDVYVRARTVFMAYARSWHGSGSGGIGMAGDGGGYVGAGPQLIPCGESIKSAPSTFQNLRAVVTLL